MLQSVGAWWMWSGFAVFVIAMIARGHVFPASPRRGVLWFTPLFLVLVLVELSDIVFAVDSIPAGAGLSLLLLATTRPRQDRTHPEHPVYSARRQFHLLDLRQLTRKPRPGRKRARTILIRTVVNGRERKIGLILPILTQYSVPNGRPCDQLNAGCR